MMRITGKTDIGKRRAENQDNYRAGRQPDDTVWAVVCDGMGGARGGAVASSIAVGIMEEQLATRLVPQFDTAGMRGLLEDAAQQANRRIYEYACADPSKQGMGTTLVACVLRDGCAYIIHAGDSRAYLYRDGQLERLTRDHSMVQELVENGSITVQEAELHPKKNLITRAVGVYPELQIEYGEHRTRPGDVLLLCTDGLTNYIREEKIAKLLDSSEFYSAADAMVSAALAAGGQDNITAVLLKVEVAEV